MASKKLEGKKALITGAATGIGKEVARVLALHGADVAINYLPTTDQEIKAGELANDICRVVQGHGCQSLLLPGNVSQEEDVEKIFQTISERWGHLDILINNAGIQEKMPSHELSLESYDRVMNTNAKATFLCSREAIKQFLKHKIKGVIINNTSVHQLIPKPQYLSYSMSKGAIMNLTRTLALEYADRHIRINNVAPGAIITPINPWSNDPQKRKKIETHIPLGEVGHVEQVAKAVLFLASTDSDYVTGQTLFIDGGLTLYPDFGEDWSSS